MRHLPPLLALASLVAFLAFPAAAEPPAPPAPPSGPVVVDHALEVVLLPAERRLVATDKLTVVSPTLGRTLDLELAPALGLTASYADVDGKAVPVTRVGARIEGLKVPMGTSTVTISYVGEVFDVVKKAGDLGWVAGDGTTGLISEKGVYLCDASRWVPMVRGAPPALFHVKAKIPAPFHVVTQGTVPERTTYTAEGVTWNVLTAKAAIATDGLTLVAGPYVTKSRVVDGVTLSTFFYESEAAEQDLWLEAGAEVVKRYAPVLGPYPHPKFDVVANFFQTGYGMPSFTLLGDEVLRYVSAGAKRSGGKIPPGYLDHEYVHGWYGNGLFVDYAKGNWCEGLTTYLSNYWAKELESPEAARAHRRSVLERFSLRVHGAKDVPVRAFRQKTEDTDNDIGYGKASLIFHQIRRIVGEQAFWATLRSYTQARVGTVVSWDDWIAAFDAASDADVAGRVTPYLERPGLPAVEISEVQRSEANGTHRIAIRLRQTPPADGGGLWPLILHVHASAPAWGGVGDELDLSNGEATFELERPQPAKEFAVDREYDALRRIAYADLPPSLERTLAKPGGVVVLAGGAEATFKPLAEQIAAQKGFRVVGADFDLAAFDGPALVLQVAKEGERSFEVGGQRYDDPLAAALVSTVEGGRARTVFTALSDEAAARASRLPFYGWDPWVVFRGGRPIARDPRKDERPSTSVSWSPAPAGMNAAAGDAARVKADLTKLCSAEFEGRWPGSKGHGEAQKFLKERAKAWSAVEPHEMKFLVGRVKRTSSRDITIVYEDRKEVLKDAFRPLTSSQERALPTPESFEVAEWSNPSILDLALDANGRTSSQVFYVLTPEAEAGLSPFLDTIGDLMPATVAELKKPGRDGKPRPAPVLGPWLAGRRARIAPFLTVMPRVVGVVSAETGKQLEQAWENEGRVSVEAAWEAPQACANILAIPAALAPERELMDPRPKPPAVVLCAHYDAFGMQDGKLWQGADDNASGVACLLEVLQLVPAAKANGEGGAPALIVLFSDAEEWGLRGARHAAEMLKKRYDVRAVINVDSIGRAGTKPMHVIGSSKHPALAAKVRGALEAAGLKIGPDIDPYAYEHGSDHWPFHEAEMPAITLWASDYAVMNTGADTLDKVDPAGVAKVAGALATLLETDLAGLAAPAR